MRPNQLATRFILIEPSHAGNVGAAARALKVMGFADLVLVRPRWADVLQRPEAQERASGATDVLAAARVLGSLDEALSGITHLCATAMTARDFGPPTLAPREHLSAWVRTLEAARLDSDEAAGEAARVRPGAWAEAAPAPATAGIAFLFGPERYGLSNADVYRCHASLRIPTAPGYGSLNLAAAVQLIAYEWRLALEGLDAGALEPLAVPAPGTQSNPARPSTPANAAPPCPAALPPRAATEAPADAAAIAAALAHWQEALVALEYLDPAAPKKLLPRLNQLLNRAQPTLAEIHILRGVARAALRLAARAKG